MSRVLRPVESTVELHCESPAKQSSSSTELGTSDFYQFEISVHSNCDSFRAFTSQLINLRLQNGLTVEDFRNKERLLVFTIPGFPFELSNADTCFIKSLFPRECYLGAAGVDVLTDLIKDPVLRAEIAPWLKNPDYFGEELILEVSLALTTSVRMFFREGRVSRLVYRYWDVPDWVK